MSYEDCDQECGGGDHLYLGDDGDAASGMVCGEPWTEKPGGAWKESTRFIFAVVDNGVVGLLSVSSKGYKLLKAHRHEFDRNRITLTRVGARGDINTRYTLEMTPCQEAERRDADTAYLDYRKKIKDEERAAAKAEKGAK